MHNIAKTKPLHWNLFNLDHCFSAAGCKVFKICPAHKFRNIGIPRPSILSTRNMEPFQGMPKHLQEI